MKTYDDWKSTDPADYMDYDDYDPSDDPIVQIEMATTCLQSQADYLARFANSVDDLSILSGVLPDIHAAWATLGLILSKYQGVLPRAA